MECLLCCGHNYGSGWHARIVTAGRNIPISIAANDTGRDAGKALASSASTVERLYREIRALSIYEAATEVQQLVIARQTLTAYEQQACA
jgi:alkylation response protein AidB-like acyl-CoA dehydrogenase